MIHVTKASENDTFPTYTDRKNLCAGNVGKGEKTTKRRILHRGGEKAI